jgi:hypothetical protein
VDPPWPAEPVPWTEERQRWLDEAWGRMVVLHTPFLPVEQREYARLVDRYRDLELLVLRDPELEGYYAETFHSIEPGPAQRKAPKGPAAQSTPQGKLDHVASLQAQLMEDVFYSFRLDRYANAPDNRGWMNLFRRWGRSSVFSEKFQLMRATYSKDFVDFYDYYIRDRDQIDLDPVPHPWDPMSRKLDPRAPPTPTDEDREWVKRILHPPKAATRYIPGVFLDSGIREAEPQKPQAPDLPSYGHAADPVKPNAPGAPPPAPPAGGAASDPGGAIPQ